MEGMKEYPACLLYYEETSPSQEEFTSGDAMEKSCVILRYIRKCARK